MEDYTSTAKMFKTLPTISKHRFYIINKEKQRVAIFNAETGKLRLTKTDLTVFQLADLSELITCIKETYQ